MGPLPTDERAGVLDALVVGALLQRTWWREGSVAERVHKAEKSAKRRAKMDADYIDPELERRVAKLAKAVRKAHS